MIGDVKGACELCNDKAALANLDQAMRAREVLAEGAKLSS